MYHSGLDLCPWGCYGAVFFKGFRVEDQIVVAHERANFGSEALGGVLVRFGRGCDEELRNLTPNLRGDVCQYVFPGFFHRPC